MCRFARLLAIGGVLTGALMLAFAVPAGAKPWRTIDTAVDRGRFPAVFVSSGIFERPKKFRLKVIASPPQRVEVDWDNLCSTGSRSKGRDSTFRRRTRFSKKFKPLIKGADWCWLTISVDTGFNARGKLKAVLSAKRR